MYYITIVIPVFKALSYIDNALSSLCGKIKFEVVIVIDDQASISDYQNVISGQEFPIRILRNSKNMGVTFSRNKGYFFSQGRIVLFLDADDELTVTVDELWASMINSNAQLYLFKCVDARDSSIGTPSVYEGSETDVLELVRMNKRGERLLAVKKQTCSKPPFIGSTRGHEMAGLLRFSNSIPNFKLLYSPVAARRYRDVNDESLSMRRFEHSKSLALGHYIVGRELLRRNKVICLLWLLKACFRRWL